MSFAFDVLGAFHGPKSLQLVIARIDEIRWSDEGR